jgi:hypothetical protein
MKSVGQACGLQRSLLYGRGEKCTIVPHGLHTIVNAFVPDGWHAIVAASIKFTGILLPGHSLNYHFFPCSSACLANALLSMATLM